MQLILASSSPYRRELLAKLGLSFDWTSPDIDETPHENELPQAMVERLAVAKARAIADIYPRTLVIASDQTASFNNLPIGKPGSRQNAIKQLQGFSGHTVTFYTALCVLNTASGILHSHVEPFEVTFRHLTDRQIAAYIDAEQPLDCAGSFKSEGLGIALFSRLNGRDPNSLIGLPLIALIDLLQRFGVDPLLPESVDSAK